jgi:hypothetical protein
MPNAPGPKGNKPSKQLAAIDQLLIAALKQGPAKKREAINRCGRPSNRPLVWSVPRTKPRDLRDLPRYLPRTERRGLRRLTILCFGWQGMNP